MSQRAEFDGESQPLIGDTKKSSAPDAQQLEQQIVQQGLFAPWPALRPSRLTGPCQCWPISRTILPIILASSAFLLKLICTIISTAALGLGAAAASFWIGMLTVCPLTAAAIFMRHPTTFYAAEEGGGAKGCSKAYAGNVSLLVLGVGGCVAEGLHYLIGFIALHAGSFGAINAAYAFAWIAFVMQFLYLVVHSVFLLMDALKLNKLGGFPQGKMIMLWVALGVGCLLALLYLVGFSVGMAAVPGMLIIKSNERE
mmetsp:Transcript_18962/g.47377  ORF Transcript_18962/g.47377 Transcript_18962/m.47377 type:complete len:255 (+) Transcript_18962:225-989(+)|eukprot:g14711.t1